MDVLHNFAEDVVVEFQQVYGHDEKVVMMEAALVAVPHLPGVSRRPGVPPRLSTAQALISRVRAIMAGGFDLADTNIYI